MSKNTEHKGHTILAFGVTDKVLDSALVANTETSVSGKNFVSWGDNNAYPQFLDQLYHNCATLKSIIDGATQYVKGEGVDMDAEVNGKGEMISELVENLARDYFIYGGFAFNVVRDGFGAVKELHYLDYQKLRTDKENNMIYYSDDWSKSFGRVKFSAYPKYREDGKNPNSVFYFKDYRKKTYTAPIYEGAINSIMTEISVDAYHLTNISTGFAGNLIVNFNNGEPVQSAKKEMEDNFYEKFCGVQNAGRPVLAYNESKDHEATITRIADDGSDKKYEELVKRSRSEIFTAFRATPNLFGLPTETTGFSQQEYKDAFKIYSKTQIQPVQKVIAFSIARVLGREVRIVPFTINWED